MARIAKRQLKQDKLVSTTATVSVFLKEHWKNIAGAIAAIVVIVGALLLYSNYRTQRNEKT